MGLAPALEPFEGSPSGGARLLIHIGIASVGAALLWSLPALSVLLGSAALGFLVVEWTTLGRGFSRVLPWCPSLNVVACLAPSNGQAKLRLILCGHYDTQRAGIIWSEAIWKRLAPLLGKLPATIQSPFLPVTLAICLQLLIGTAALMGAGRSSVTVGGVGLLVVYGIAGLLFAEWSIGAHVPGASDNASGAAAVLTLAEEWLRGPIDGVEVILLLTGCEETGLLGAAAWADRHRSEHRNLPAMFLNLDGLGFGPPRFLGVEVPLVGLPVKYPPGLLAACTRVAAARRLADAGPHSVPGFTDGLAFLVRGLPGVTVVGSQADGQLPHWHRPTDDAERMDFDAAWLGVEYAAGLVPELIGTSAAFARS